MTLRTGTRSSFELAVIDVGLPDGSGLDLCRYALAATSEWLAPR